MLVRCPRCSVPRDSEREKAASKGSVGACANCGYTGAPFGPGDDPGPREPLSTFAGARAKLETATQDLFRLSGTSIPVEAEVSAPPPPAPKPVEDPLSGRKPEASIMFSLEELMKANSSQSPGKQDDEVPEQLWSMQSSTPLFGTEYDQALLTTPLKRELTSMESMTVPSRRPPVRRLLPLVLAIAGGSAALAGVGWWVFGPTDSEASPSAEVATVDPTVAPEPAAEVAPVAGSEPAAPLPPPGEKGAAAEAPTEAAEGTPAEAALAEASEVANEAAEDAEDAEDAEAQDEAKSTKSTRKKKRSTKHKASARPAATPSSSAKASFNTAAARDALSAAASRTAGCKGTSGTGKIQLTFATSGRVSSAQLVAGPFGGTAAGKCALRHFKAAKVPAFSGSPQTVAKSFKIR